MSNPVADDFSFINKRAAEIRKEMQDELERKPDSWCSDCSSSGWVRAVYSHPAAPSFVTCPKCYNPEGKPKP